MTSFPPAVQRGVELTFALAGVAATGGAEALLAAVDDLVPADVQLALATVVAMGPPRLAHGAALRIDDEVLDVLADAAAQGTDAIVGAVRDLPHREAQIALAELVALRVVLVTTQVTAANTAAMN